MTTRVRCVCRAYLTRIPLSEGDTFERTCPDCGVSYTVKVSVESKSPDGTLVHRIQATPLPPAPLPTDLLSQVEAALPGRSP